MSLNSSRHVDLARSEAELATNIRKATSIEESAPKREDIISSPTEKLLNVLRQTCASCYRVHMGPQIFAFLLGQHESPIQADEIQTFKALITLHKVLQEGHPIAIKEAQEHTNWLENLTRVSSDDGLRGYGPLLREYVYFLLAKLAFHRQHPEFNGLFEYEEYISLNSIMDPNEGYETIMDLMSLQDQIDKFQKLIFSHFRSGANNETRISALVPLVQESYGIYKFATSMLRAMHASTGDDEALEPLRSRYDTQHYRILKFYYECSNLRYLTSLITVPKLPQEPPSLLAGEENPPALPDRPVTEIRSRPTPSPPPPNPPRVSALDPDPVVEFWKKDADQSQNQNDYNAEQRRLQEYNAEQQRLQDQWNEQQYQQQLAQQQLQQQQLAQLQSEQAFEEQRKIQAENRRREEEMLMQQQLQAAAQGQMAAIAHEKQMAQAQHENDQHLLRQYDTRLKELEGQMHEQSGSFIQQIRSKDDQIRTLHEQVDNWRTKYEALAKLYSQLRTEHLELLQKFKGVQLKAASAQEANNMREALERDMKTKKLELASMIRERDRALHEKDRLMAEHRQLLDQLKSTKRGNDSLTWQMVDERDENIRRLTRALEDAHEDFERTLRENEEELDVWRSGGNDVLEEVVKRNLQEINDIIDSVLQAGVRRVDDAMYELDSSMQAGNQNASAPYVLSQIEKAQSSATAFSTAFNGFIAEGLGSAHADIIRTLNVYAGSIADLLSDTKGLTRFATEENKANQLIESARLSARASIKFFRALQSYRLDGLEDSEKRAIVINGVHDVLTSLHDLSRLADTFVPESGRITKNSGDLGDLVDRELVNAAKEIDAAAERLSQLRKKPREGIDTYELSIHDSILDGANAVTDAIRQLIKAATASQQEIVKEGRGSMSRTAFYKKNNRWTEGLVSAAKAVAYSTNTLIEMADGVITGTNIPEELIVASNDVAASTAQLVAAARVKAKFGSPTQDRLEEASKAVKRACKNLVEQVIASKNKDDEEDVDYTSLSNREFKKQELAQKVAILQLEDSLSKARQKLGEMRKISYQEDD